MKILLLTALLLFALAPSALAVDPILQELAAIRNEIKQMRKTIAEINQEAIEAEAAQEFRDKFSRKSLPSPTIPEVKYPDVPTEAALRKYVADVLSLKPHSRWKTSDPQVRMLERVGSENIRYLLEVYEAHKDSSVEGYLRTAIGTLGGDEIKQWVFDRLPRNEKLLALVKDKGWMKDAIPVLSNCLLPNEWSTKNRIYLDDDNPWFGALVESRDPDAYAALKEAFRRSNFSEYAYTRIKGLPGIELAEMIDNAWREALEDQPQESRRIAAMAVEQGNIDAFIFLGLWVATIAESDAEAGDVRSLLLRHCDFRGAPREMNDWIQDNQDHLEWDSNLKKFRL